MSIVQGAPSSVTTLAPVGEPANETADDLAWLSLEVQKAQRQIDRGLAELAEGVVSLSGALLEIQRRRLYRFDPDAELARSFALFVRRRFGISETLARQYIDAIGSLGEANYHTLLRDVGVQRTFALALLNQTDPSLVAAFQQLPVAERQTVTVTQLTAVTQTIQAKEQETTERRLAHLEQELSRNEGLLNQSRQRLRDVEAMHQESVQSIIDERDDARQDAERQQQEASRLRGLLKQSTQPVMKQPALAPPSAEHSVVVVVPVDIASLVLDVRSLAEKLERLRHIAPSTIPADQGRDLAGSLQALQQTVIQLLA